MRPFPLRLASVLALAFVLAIAPAASATGYLVNVGVGSSSFVFGANVFGGSGDTLDVGLMNEQCSDEADVVDVGIMNTEGGWACYGEDRCTHNEGSDPLDRIIVIPTVLEPGGEPTEAHCSDDSDAIDVGVLNNEGSATYECDDFGCNETYEGDMGDATDAGVLNCEYGDQHDATDIGVLNNEWDDRWDTLDLSILNNEWTEGGDTNGIGLGGSFATGFAVGCDLIRIDLPVGPTQPHLPVGPLLP